MNAQDYSILIQRTEDEEGFIFEARVLEFPDLTVFEESWAEAYAVVLEMIEGLMELSEEMGHEVPVPYDSAEPNYSGKMTFRPGRRLHRDISAAAAVDGLSQNQWLCNIVAQAVTTKVAQDQIREVAAHVVGNMLASANIKWNTVVAPKQTYALVHVDDETWGESMVKLPCRQRDDAGIGLFKIGTSAATAQPESCVTLSHLAAISGS